MDIVYQINECVTIYEDGFDTDVFDTNSKTVFKTLERAWMEIGFMLKDLFNMHANNDIHIHSIEIDTRCKYVQIFIELNKIDFLKLHKVETFTIQELTLL